MRFVYYALGPHDDKPSSRMATDTAGIIRRTGLQAEEFGAKFDGNSDDTLALQRGVDEAALQRRPLVLPSGIALLSAPIDLKGRHIALIGNPTGNTVLKASEAMSCLLDANDASESIDSPLYLYGLTLDGSGGTEAGLRLRYRHRTVFDTVAITACDTGVDELDSWLGRRVNCRTRATVTGWRLRGANHSSLWVGCSFTDSLEVHLDIAGAGSAHDGNDALLFQACDIEFGKGDGVHVSAGATATFDTCYLGEGIKGDLLRNEGVVLVRGGTIFVGSAEKPVGIRALAGRVTVDGASVYGQEFGALDRLAGSGSSTSTGKVNFRDVNLQVKLGGNPVLTGDVLGYAPMPVFAPVLGRNWGPTAFDASFSQTSVADASRVQCRHVTGANPMVGLAGTLHDTVEARVSGPAYIAIVYEASAPVELKATTGATSLAPWQLIGVLPATRGVSTYIKADVSVAFARFSLIELIMRATEGDALTLYHATINDGSVLALHAATLALAR
jgi:hypothetical protein